MKERQVQEQNRVKYQYKRNFTVENGNKNKIKQYVGKKTSIYIFILIVKNSYKWKCF